MYEKRVIGQYGEDLACEYLQKKEYHILDRNFKCRQGEIDIIAFDVINNEITFCEVKTRTNFNYGFPSESVNWLKKKRILSCVKYYLFCNKLEDKFIRVDVIEIVISKESHKYKINHLKAVI